MRLLPNVNGLSVPRAALAYVEAGVPIVPFYLTRGNGKECGNLVGNRHDYADRWIATLRPIPQESRWRSKFGGFKLDDKPRGVRLSCDRFGLSAILAGVLAKYLKSAPYVNTRSAFKRKGHYWFTLPPAHPR